MQTKALPRLFLLPFLAFHQISNDGQTETEWNYKQHGADWGGTCATGNRQSPLQLFTDRSKSFPLPRIVFKNYEDILSGPMTLKNDGHTVHIDIPKTKNNQHPVIFGGYLKGIYAAEHFHFHWGSPYTRGSEHWIDYKQFDVEMHIVHRNIRYSDLKEATKYSDGVAVIALLFRIVKNPNRLYPGLNRVLNALPKVIKYDSEYKLIGPMSTSQLLGDVDRRNYFTYKGSLTTPECSQSVTWTVFSDILPLPYLMASNLWRLRNSEGHNIVNNYRLPQSRRGRPIVYRTPIWKQQIKQTG